MKIGYIRVSTQRPELQKLPEYVRQGDADIVESIRLREEAIAIGMDSGQAAYSCPTGVMLCRRQSS